MELKVDEDRSQAGLRAKNLAAVAGYVRTHDPVSRREVGDALRLNKSTVSGLVSELIGRGILTEGERRFSVDPGRPAAELRLDDALHASVVVEVLPEIVNVNVFTLGGYSLDFRTLELAPRALGPDATLEHLVTGVAGIVGSLRRRGRVILGVTVALPGLVDAPAGRVVVSEPLAWGQVDVRGRFKKNRAFASTSVDVGRLATLATVAEWRRVPTTRDLVCMYGSATGVGAGIVVAGRLVVGSHGRAGEVLQATAQTGSGNLGLSADQAGVLAARLATDDTDARATLERSMDAFAPRLATTIALVDPDTVVLSGYFTVLAADILKTLAPRLHQLLAPRPENDVAIVSGHHGTDAARVGAALLQADHALQPAAFLASPAACRPA